MDAAQWQVAVATVSLLPKMPDREQLFGASTNIHAGKLLRLLGGTHGHCVRLASVVYVPAEL